MDTAVSILEPMAHEQPPARNRERDWRLAVPSGSFIDADGAARFAKRLTAVDADEVAIPMVFDAFDGHRVARWQVVARRRGATGAGRVRVYLPYEPASPAVPYADALACLQAGDPERALARFVRHFEHDDDPSHRAAVARWIALALVELDRDVEAAAVLRDGLEAHPNFSDLSYLLAIVRSLQGAGPDEVKALLGAAESAGDSTTYPEFFYGIRELVKTRSAA
jgi:hypothetical protein